MTLKLLLVGKDKSAFQSIKDAFENEDADIIVATSIGLALFLARKNQPNLIISQQELLDSDGINFFHELKNEQELADIPFIWLNILSLVLNEKNDLSSHTHLRDRILAFVTKYRN